MKIISYWQAVKCVESSTPNDTPDNYYILGEYTTQELAEAEVDRNNKKLFEKLRKSPGYPTTHTRYFARYKELRLIENEAS